MTTTPFARTAIAWTVVAGFLASGCSSTTPVPSASYPDSYLLGPTALPGFVVVPDDQLDTTLLQFKVDLTANPGPVSTPALRQLGPPAPLEARAILLWKADDHNVTVLAIAMRFASADAAAQALAAAGCVGAIVLSRDNVQAKIEVLDMDFVRVLRTQASDTLATRAAAVASVQ